MNLNSLDIVLLGRWGDIHIVEYIEDDLADPGDFIICKYLGPKPEYVGTIGLSPKSDILSKLCCQITSGELCHDM